MFIEFILHDKKWTVYVYNQILSYVLYIGSDMSHILKFHKTSARKCYEVSLWQALEHLVQVS